jgi:hypothetical protein
VRSLKLYINVTWLLLIAECNLHRAELLVDIHLDLLPIASNCNEEKTSVPVVQALWDISDM